MFRQLRHMLIGRQNPSNRARRAKACAAVAAVAAAVSCSTALGQQENAGSRNLHYDYYTPAATNVQPAADAPTPSPSDVPTPSPSDVPTPPPIPAEPAPFSCSTKPGCTYDYFAPQPTDTTAPDNRDLTQQQAPQNFGGLSQFGGTTAGSQGPGAGMIGDYFGGGVRISAASATAGTPDFVSVGIAGGDRVMKLFSDNTFAAPQNRIFYDFRHFSNAAVPGNSTAAAPDSISVVRHMLGWEQTFFGGLFSGEMRMPFSRGLDDHQFTTGSGNAATELGNMTLAWKALLWRSRFLTVSAGSGMILPTADDTVLFSTLGGTAAPSVLVKNDAYHVQPFLAMQFTPIERLWLAFHYSHDFAVNGNKVDFITGNGAGFDGKINDQNLLFFDMALGYWLWRDPSMIFAGMAPIFEMHYTTTMQDTDILTGGPDVITNPFNRIDTLNATGGLRLQFLDASFLTVGVVTPLRTLNDKQFDAEIGVTFVQAY